MEALTSVVEICGDDNSRVPGRHRKSSKRISGLRGSDLARVQQSSRSKENDEQLELFKPATYQTFVRFNSPEFVQTLSRLFGMEALFADDGLNGGGLHIHRRGGKLNTHLDYSIHPKRVCSESLTCSFTSIRIGSQNG
jgi:hypothetical protein